jgi:FkbM family methyltransferase
MIDWIASFFRSVNARLVGENRWLIQKILKISFGVSGYLHKKKLGYRNKFLIIKNFDRNLKLKINCSWSMGFAIYWSGFHEFHEFLYLDKFLSSNMVFIDVGANLGEYTLFAAKRVNKGKVISFEPLPKMLENLKENIKLNQFENIQVLNYGLSDKENTLPIHEIEDAHEGLSTFFPGTLKSRNSSMVSLKVLDSQFESFEVDRIDFIKIDIEGGELFALQGSKNLIEKFKPIVMIEINKQTYEAAGYAIEDVFKFFTDLSYQSFTIGKNGDLTPLLQIPTFENIVFKSS